MDKSNTLAITNLDIPVLRVGIVNLYIVIIAISLGILIKVFQSEMVLWLKSIFAFILLFPSLIAIVDYWRAIARIEFFDKHMRLVFSFRSMDIEYNDIDQVSVFLNRISKWASIKISRKGNKSPVKLSFIGFKTNWGSIEKTIEDFKGKLSSERVAVT